METYLIFRHKDADSDWSFYRLSKIYVDAINNYGSILRHLHLVPDLTQYDPILFCMDKAFSNKMRDAHVQRQYNLKYVVEITDICTIREANGMDLERFLRL